MPSLRIRYQTIEFDDMDIHLRTLRDLQEYQDEDNRAANLGISSANWSLFGVVWPSSIILAEFLLNFSLEGKRILEIGCGIGVVSLVLNKLLADITATDYHPDACSFLRKNAILNNGPEIPFVRTDWADSNDVLGEFDLLVGSDLLYETDQVNKLAGFIEHHAKTQSEVVIADPGRGNHARFSKKMVELGYSHSKSVIESVDPENNTFKGSVLHYAR